MKVTKRQLKKVIKEELEAAMSGHGGDEMAQAEELAQALAQSPAIMDFVNKAAQNPEVQATVEKAKAEIQGTMQEYKSPEDRYADMRDSSMVPAVGGVSTALATAHVGLMGKIGMVGAGTVGAATTIGLPVAAGLMAIALGILIYKSFSNC